MARCMEVRVYGGRWAPTVNESEGGKGSSEVLSRNRRK